MDKTDNPNDKIPVSVRFDDDYDEVEIEEAAYQRSGIKQDFFETEEIRINSMSNSMKSQGATELEISSYREEEQKELKREIDRYREHRNKSITHFGKKSMVSFLLNSGIEVDSVQSICVGIPFVPLVWLTAEQICALDDNPLVTNLDYVDVNCELEDYASVEDARAIIGGKL